MVGGPFVAEKWLIQNWRSLVFTPEHAREHAHEFYDPRGATCGVYLVLERSEAGCAYVGSSFALQHRLRNGGHMPCDAPTFSFDVPRALVRDVEATYWWALRPRLNQMSPPGGVREVMVAQIRLAWSPTLAEVE